MEIERVNSISSGIALSDIEDEVFCLVGGEGEVYTRINLTMLNLYKLAEKADKFDRRKYWGLYEWLEDEDLEVVIELNTCEVKFIPLKTPVIRVESKLLVKGG